VSGPIVSDCTHATLEQGLPEGIESFVSHAPVHPAEGSNAVAVPVCPHIAALAVIVVGNAHDPVGGVHIHVAQVMGAFRSA
jgi:hypothetical protein